MAIPVFYRSFTAAPAVGEVATSYWQACSILNRGITGISSKRLRLTAPALGAANSRWRLAATWLAMVTMLRTASAAAASTPGRKKVDPRFPIDVCGHGRKTRTVQSLVLLQVATQVHQGLWHKLPLLHRRRDLR